MPLPPHVLSYAIIRVCGVIPPPSSCNSRRRRFGIYKLITNDYIYLYYGCHIPISRPLPPRDSGQAMSR